MRYDPLTAPDAEEWHELDEGERIDLIAQYHRRAKIRLPNEPMHAAIHMIVENQNLAGDEIPVQSTLERLMREGLDRHEALHAIGKVLIEHMYSLLQTEGDCPAPPDANDPYYSALAELNACDSDCAPLSDAKEDRLGDPDFPLNWPPERYTPTKPYPNVGRNDPCPCGSGKKFKKCCLH